MPFTATKLDDAAVDRLVKLYRETVDSLLDDFDNASDFSRHSRLLLIAQVNKELNKLGVDTKDWLDKEVVAAYESGMKAALSGLDEVNGYKVFYHGSGKFNGPPGNNLFGPGLYLTDDPKVAKMFGKVEKVYLNIYNPNEILRINNQAEYEAFVKAAQKKYPKLSSQDTMPKWASGKGYKAIIGAKGFDELAGINVLDKALVTSKPIIPVKTLFTQPNKLQVAALIDDTSKAFGDAMTLVGRNVQSITTKAFQREIRARIAEGVVSSETRKQIVAGVKQELRARGMTALTDRGGKNWTLDRYADMLARTKLTEARNSGMATKMLENGQDLVQVSINGSDHEACAEWEGKVLSMTGKTDGFDTVDQAQSDGLFHPNCKHTINPIEMKIAAETFGWDTEAQDYRQGVFEESVKKGGRIEDDKQSKIEALLNKGDTKGAKKMIDTVNDKDLKAGLKSMMKFYDD